MRMYGKMLAVMMLLSWGLVACGADGDEEASAQHGEALALAGDAVDLLRCVGPNPAGCTQLGCATKGEECVVDPSTCEPSACTCTSQGWVCTKDCGGGGVCEPVEKSCEGPNPAGCAGTGCDEGESCVVDPNQCIPSACGCVDGNWVCTADCNGGSCEPDVPACTTPNPAGCTQEGCDDGEVCVVDPAVCAPSHCVCAGGDQWGCTRDCGGGGECVPRERVEGSR